MDIEKIIEKLKSEMQSIPLGERFVDGPLAGASVYNVMAWAYQYLCVAAQPTPAPDAEPDAPQSQAVSPRE